MLAPAASATKHPLHSAGRKQQHEPDHAIEQRVADKARPDRQQRQRTELSHHSRRLTGSHNAAVQPFAPHTVHSILRLHLVPHASHRPAEGGIRSHDLPVRRRLALHKRAPSRRLSVHDIPRPLLNYPFEVASSFCCTSSGVICAIWERYAAFDETDVSGRLVT